MATAIPLMQPVIPAPLYYRPATLYYRPDPSLPSLVCCNSWENRRTSRRGAGAVPTVIGRLRELIRRAPCGSRATPTSPKVDRSERMIGV